jgi:hypothetical protein
MGLCKSCHIKKRERKEKKKVEKMDKCLRYLKQWVLREREMNKIAPAL